MNDPRQQRGGVIYGLAAFGAWGVLPVYFKALASVPPLEVLAHRIVWSVFLLFGLSFARGRLGDLAGLLRSRRTQLTLMVTTGLIATNWGLFIWSIANGHLVEASLGYFINPLVNVALGFVFLRERLRPLQTVAVALAAVAITFRTVQLGHPPVIALTLAFSFGLYGLLRKRVDATAIVGLTVETMMLAPLAVGWMAWRRSLGELSFLSTTLPQNLLMLAAGVITALPLLWFTEAARRLRLATLGFLQYLAPTGQLLLAVLAYGEPFTRMHAISFGLIWIALGLYSVEMVRENRSAARMRPAAQ